MARRSFTDKDRVRIFLAADGICHLCGFKIFEGRERWEIEHVIAWALTRDDSDDNLRPAHFACHKEKTAVDVGNIAEAKRREAKHMGAHRSRNPMPGSKASGLKKRMDGTVVRRSAFVRAPFNPDHDGGSD